MAHWCMPARWRPVCDQHSRVSSIHTTTASLCSSFLLQSVRQASRNHLEHVSWAGWAAVDGLEQNAVDARAARLLAVWLGGLPAVTTLLHRLMRSKAPCLPCLPLPPAADCAAVPDGHHCGLLCHPVQRSGPLQAGRHPGRNQVGAGQGDNELVLCWGLGRAAEARQVERQGWRPGLDRVCPSNSPPRPPPPLLQPALPQRRDRGHELQ